MGFCSLGLTFLEKVCLPIIWYRRAGVMIVFLITPVFDSGLGSGVYTLKELGH
jgi:hypothetical protein